MSRRTLAFLSLAFLLSTPALAQSLVVGSPFRVDGLLAPGASAVIRLASAGEGYWLATDPVTFADDDGLRFELAGARISIDGRPAPLWAVFRESIHFIIPDNLPILPRTSHTLRLTTEYGAYSLPIRLAATAPGLGQDSDGHLAGLWITENRWPQPLTEQIPVTANTVLILIASGIGPQDRAKRALAGRGEGFVPSLAIWIGSRRIEAYAQPYGYPGLHSAWCYVPADLPSGEYEIRLQSGRGITESGMRLRFHR